MKIKHSSTLWVLFSTACILFAMLHSFYSGNAMVKRHAPLMEAALQVKLEAAIAHLWFEEIISGDRYIDIDKVWQHIDRAQWYANAMLHGGKDESLAPIFPLENPQLRKKVDRTIAGIKAFRAIAQRRWTAQPDSLVGSEIDQLFDQTFEEFLASADGLVVAQKLAMRQELRRFRQVQTGLIVCVGFLGLLISWLLFRYENRRANDMQALQESEALLAKTQRMALIGSWSQDRDSNRIKLTQEARRILELETLEGQSFVEAILPQAHPDDRANALQVYQQSLAANSAYDIQLRLSFGKGRIKYVNLRGETNCDSYNKPLHALGSIQDMTEQKLSEDALRRAQKMDSIGQLTGGIAHDFNNIMAIILGNISLLTHQNEGKDQFEKRINAIEKSAQRASVLTKQLLGLSRHQSAEITVVDINQTINQTMDLISRSLTPQIEVSLHLSSQLWATEVDPGEFQDALLNLILNARDAMDGRGCLTLETSNQVIDELYCSLNQEASPGRYIKLSVSDTGSGIPLDIQPRLFEPFFTTKEQGKGTGLGLSMVYSFVKRSGGYVTIHSEETRGTSFNIYLPYSTRQIVQVSETQMGEIPRGNEAILAVDDEMGLLEVARASLEALGYTVFTANNGKQALEIIEQEPTIELLFSDVVMQGDMNGYELAEQATTLNPAIRVLLTSGYTEKAVANSGLEVFKSNVLGKPYNRADLAIRVRQTLG